ncbi:CARDB domain-containing protein [Paenibacillus thalictri]|uniref:CARDB domain-containing protein n=1 Tax=Paenibacillus thalictri TaxID=2527873 RepID=UPI0013EF02A4|nr:CARDB domain-containing protein [Paenibacillus thalictri]
MGLPGAKIIIYFAAFTVDITAKTYKYPDSIKVTYKDAPATDNLTITGGSELCTAGTLQLDALLMHSGSVITLRQDANLIWSSSSPTIADVSSSGLVSSGSITGNATITAKYTGQGLNLTAIHIITVKNCSGTGGDPDLIVSELLINGCYGVGDTVAISYKVKNQGGSTSTTFRVSLRRDGTEVDYLMVNGLSAGAEKGKTFNFKFTSTVAQAFTVVADSTNTVLEADEANNTRNEYFTAQAASCAPPPETPGIKGDFIFSRGSTITWGNPQVVTPVDIEVTGSCHYAGHKFKFLQDTFGYTSDILSPESMTRTLFYNPGSRSYDGGIGSGTVIVTMTILTDCSTYSEVTHTFEILPDPSNRPPLLEIAWNSTSTGNQTSSVVLGQGVYLKVVSMSDPDGDSTTITWDFSHNSWTQALPTKYNWPSPYNKLQYTGISADQVGYFKVCAIAKDSFGAKSQNSCTYLDVIGPEPIPVITGGTMVKEGKTLTPALSGENSYSPAPGRTIDHNRDEWTNKQDIYYTPGEVTATLSVFDNTGLKSLFAATHKITVYPDIPPIPDLEFSTPITRVPKYFRNTSYSPDGDNIAVYTTTWGYDYWNNGACDPTVNLISNDNNYFAFQPPRIGTYCFRVYAKEDGLGKDAYKDYTIEVINDNPEVTFTAKGITSEPSPMNIVTYTPAQMVSWTNTSLDKSSIKNYWRVNSSGSLVSSKRPIAVAPYSFPSTPALSAPVLIKCPPADANCSVGMYIGNNWFLGRASTGSYGYIDYYLLSPYNMPIKIGSFQENTTGYSTQSTYDRDLGELIIYSSYVYGNGYNSAGRSVSWSRYKLSDLANGAVTVKASGSFSGSVTNNGNGCCTTYSGTYPSYSTGGFIGYKLLEFNGEYKDINVTTRTIRSYKSDNKTVPYKTETYDIIPAFGKVDVIGWCHVQWTSCVNGPPLIDQYLTPFLTPYGDYMSIMNGSLIKWDGDTGQPSMVRPNVIPANAGQVQSVDGLWLRASYSNPDPFCSTSEDGCNNYLGYVSLETGLTQSNAPAGVEFPSSYYVPLVGNNGWGITNYEEQITYPNWCLQSDANDNCIKYGAYTFTQTSPAMGDVGAKYAVAGNKMDYTLSSIWTSPYDRNIFDDGYLKYKNNIYTFTPETGQTPVTNEYYTFGQLVNPASQQVTNGTVSWTAKYHHFDYVDMAAGAAFRIQDYKNMYRVEADKKTISLVKIVNGRKTLLGSASRAMLNEQWVSYSVKLSGTHVKVYENNGLAIDAYDGTFSQGTVGVFSTADNTEFKGISYMWSDADLLTETPGVAIVDTEVTYETTYTDPESDPRFDPATQWQYQHVDTTKFLDIGDGKSGLSSHHGQTLTTPILSFDKVGVYKVDYRVPDDPHPDHRLAYGDNTYAAYSKYADWYTQYLIVHRRPVSNFTLAVNTTTHLIQWTDYSYDPDRCYNVGNCQSGYATNHGIYKKKFYYITPSGNMTQSKLERPQESGTYTIAMAVADEYGAWSDWYEQTIAIDSAVPPDNPPNVQLTFPTGSYSDPTPVSLQPTIAWNQSDPDPGTEFSVFDLNVKNEWGGCVECKLNQNMSTYNTSWAWTLDNLLAMGQKYQVQVRVSDGEMWSPWSGIGWMATNSPPAAYMSYPYGTESSPTLVNTQRPTFTWAQTDPDPGTVFMYFQIQVTNEANNVMLLDSGVQFQGTTSNGGSWLAAQDLPAGQKLRVRVMVWDQYGSASPWSPQVWMYINRAPVADFDWSPNPAYEGDVIAIVNRSTDPDGDPLTAAWSISGPGGYSSTQSTPNAGLSGSDTDGQPGSYVVTLTVCDPSGACNTAVKSIPVGDLTLQGFVKHFDKWNEHRQSYNVAKSGDPERPRPYDMFWAGEGFRLEAKTNVPAVSVTVVMSRTNRDASLTSGDKVQWSGELRGEDFEKLADGSYTFSFTGIWANGHKETDVQTIRIQGHWTEYTDLVRKY